MRFFLSRSEKGKKKYKTTGNFKFSFQNTGMLPLEKLTETILIQKYPAETDQRSTAWCRSCWLRSWPVLTVVSKFSTSPNGRDHNHCMGVHHTYSLKKIVDKLNSKCRKIDWITIHQCPGSLLIQCEGGDANRKNNVRNFFFHFVLTYNNINQGIFTCKYNPIEVIIFFSITFWIWISRVLFRACSFGCFVSFGGISRILSSAKTDDENA